jgi:5'-3' exonuclease
VRVFLIDGTYELFRYHFALPSHVTAAGMEVAATRGVLSSMLTLVEQGATHIGMATDHVIESFRNKLWPGYKSSAGMPPELVAQFPLLEEAVAAMGMVVWPMIELEADDGLASVAAVLAEDPVVDQVVICTPDKDLGQCVRDGRVVQLDRRKTLVLDAEGVKTKFGVWPESIPDYLALVGDSADGFPGLPGWGAKSTATVLAHYRHLEDIPADGREWEVRVGRPTALATILQDEWERALLFRHLATLRIDRSLIEGPDELRWRGPTDQFEELCRRIDADRVAERARALTPRC